MRRLLCLFRGHQWHTGENHATQGTEQECVRCGARRSLHPGEPKCHHGYRLALTRGASACIPFRTWYFGIAQAAMATTSVRVAPSS
jgi:hypothetical protein